MAKGDSGGDDYAKQIFTHRGESIGDEDITPNLMIPFGGDRAAHIESVHSNIIEYGPEDLEVSINGMIRLNIFTPNFVRDAEVFLSKVGPIIIEVRPDEVFRIGRGHNGFKTGFLGKNHAVLVTDLDGNLFVKNPSDYSTIAIKDWVDNLNVRVFKDNSESITVKTHTALPMNNFDVVRFLDIKPGARLEGTFITGIDEAEVGLDYMLIMAGNINYLLNSNLLKNGFAQESLIFQNYMRKLYSNPETNSAKILFILGYLKNLQNSLLRKIESES